MNSFRRSPFLRLVVLPLMLVAFLSGCYKWVELEPPVDVAPEAGQLEHVRLTMSDGRMLELQNAIVEGDSVIGFAPQRIALPIEQVQTVETRKGDALATYGLTLGILAGLVGAYFAIWAIACDDCLGGLR